MKNVMDVMTERCECIGENETIATAAKKMAELGLGALPICDDGNRLRGMLTDRDIVVQVIAAGKDAHLTQVSELEQGSATAVRADDSVDEAAFIMSDRQIRRLPVVDENDSPIGMLSQADIARSLDHGKTGKLVERISSAA